MASPSDCVAQPASTCGTTGLCDGLGACARHAAGTTCDDGQACSVNDACNGVGMCIGTVPDSCGPGAGNECCEGSCVDGLGCATVAGPCGDVCTDSVLTVDQTCQGCGAAGASGSCGGGSTYRCDASTRDLCRQELCGGVMYRCTNVAGTWAWTPGGSCDDGDACTFDDTCEAGVCRGTAVDCSSSPCMERACNGTPSCTVTPRAGQTCNDGDPCTSADRCDASGVCVGGPRVSCESTPCIARACDGSGGCTETIRTGAICDDGDLCTYSDTCSADGVCQRGTPLVCDGLDTFCSTFRCDGTSTCARVPRRLGEACDDGDPETDGDVCQADGICRGIAGCPPPAEACVNGTQNRRGCGGARTLNRLSAGGGGLAIVDNTCSARNDFDDRTGCWDADPDHSYRLYMREGESVIVRYQTEGACIGGRWSGTLKIFETGGCDNTECRSKVYCDYLEYDQTANYTAVHDGWIIIVADGSSAFDDEGQYRLTVTLTCRSGNCACQ